MNLFGFFGSEKIPESLQIDDLKKYTKVLIIDDEDPVDIKEYLKKEGWKVQYIPDLDAISNKKLIDSHVICVDIMGVGKLLGVESGMGLVKAIKQTYPEKKIIIYSSVPKHDSFDDAWDYVDKKLRKESTLLPYSSAIEELASKSLNWDDSLRYAYGKVKNHLGKNVSFDDFNAMSRKCVKNKKFDSGKLQKAADIAA
ncbi:MAG: response regulator, partial [Pseudomonadales bacterium]